MTFWTLFALVLCAAATMAQNPTPLQAVTRGASEFSTEFYKHVASSTSGNLIMSPLSAHVVLSMAAYGARKNTADEMRSVLRLPAEDSVGKSGFQNLIDEFNSVKNVTLKVANKIFVGERTAVEPEYRQLTADSFRSESSVLDFAKNVEAAGVVNKWALDNTNNKIDKLVTPDDFNGNTAMVLLNAVYFKGSWKNQFKKEHTQERPFNVDLTTKKNVPTMFRSGKYVYGELPEVNAKFIELPYENKDMKMVIVVPNEINGLPEVEKNLHLLTHDYLKQKGFERDVELYLPKFKIESSIDLNNVLSDMNMREMFTDKADFSGISKSGLKVDKVKQKAFIEVNEEGSEAAAVTEIHMPPSAPMPPKIKIYLHVDRPFYCFLNMHTNKDSLHIFESRVVNPAKV